MAAYLWNEGVARMEKIAVRVRRRGQPDRSGRVLCQTTLRVSGIRVFFEEAR